MLNPQILPFTPEPLEQLQRRFPQAPVKVHDLVECLLKRQSRAPLFCREQVFDLLHHGEQHRLIIAIERDPAMGTYLHVSITSGASVRTRHVTFDEGLLVLRLIWPAAPQPYEQMRSEHGIPNLFFDPSVLAEVAHARA